MKVKDLMTAEPGYCTTSDTLDKAAEIMSARDCGVVPVVDSELRVIGMITDRDICMAAAARGQKLKEIKAGDIIKGKIVTCRPDDGVADVLKKMKKGQLRRLAVTDGDKRLTGIISIRDIIFVPGKSKAVKKKIFAALREIGRPGAIVLQEIDER
jgi:CBS domain-containing protein